MQEWWWCVCLCQHGDGLCESGDSLCQSGARVTVVSA